MFNLINSIVGAGIIGIPYAFSQSGLVTGLFLLVLVSYLTGKFEALRLLRVSALLTSFFLFQTKVFELSWRQLAITHS